jgi:hypothetical protein
MIGELSITAAAGELVQLDRVLSDTLGYTGEAFATVTTDDADARYTAYISVVDGGTGDPAFIPGVEVVSR